MSLGQLAIQWEGGVCGRLELRGRQSYLHSPPAPPHRHTVSEVSDEMKSLIIEKNKMALEEEPELLVKGELIMRRCLCLIWNDFNPFTAF